MRGARVRVLEDVLAGLATVATASVLAVGLTVGVGDGGAAPTGAEAPEGVLGAVSSAAADEPVVAPCIPGSVASQVPRPRPPATDVAVAPGSTVIILTIEDEEQPDLSCGR